MRMDGEHLSEINKKETFNTNSFNVWVDPSLLMVKKNKNGQKVIGGIYGKYLPLKHGLNLRKIILIENNAKCFYLKKLSCKRTLRQVRPPPLL
jgi:hypothetical protein